MKRGLVSVLGLSLSLGGCNSILGIEEADVVTDDLSRDGAPPSGVAVELSASLPGSAPDDAGAATCSKGEKSCQGACFAVTDPRQGCTTECAPACELPNATPMCADDACAIAACADGYQDCNGDPTDGCEVDTSQPDNCGECGNVCPDTEPFCDQGTCVPDPGP